MSVCKPRVLLLIFFGVVSSFYSSAQNREADSLKQLLSVTTADTMKVFLRYKISDAYQLTEPLTALKHADTAYKKAEEIKFEKGQARSLTRIGNLYASMGEFDTSLGAHLASLKISERLKDEKGIAASYNNIALVFTTRNLKEDYKSAISNFRNAQTYFEKFKDSSSLCRVFLNIGDAFEKMDILDSALYFSSIANEIAMKIGDIENLGVTLINIGNVYYKMGNTEAALKDFRSGVRYLEEAEDDHSLATAWLLISMCLEKQQNVDAAIFYTIKSLQLAKATSNQPTLLEGAKRLAGLYASSNRLDSAYVYEKLASHTDSTINNTKRAAKIELLKYEEQVRQKGLADKREATAKKNVEAIQKWIIVGLIITLFIALFILSRRKKHPRAIGALSFVVLLLAFEFITFIIHPIVDRITDHKPIYMVPILALVASIIGPLHHRFSHWLKRKLGTKELHQHSDKDNDAIIKAEEPQANHLESQHETNVESASEITIPENQSSGHHQ